MRAKAHECERPIFIPAIDQHQVRPEMTIAMVFPFARKRVIEIPGRQGFAGEKQAGNRFGYRSQPRSDGGLAILV
jgi:hypothetical protein